MLLRRKEEAEKTGAPAEHIKALEAKLEVFEQIKSGKWRYTREFPGSGRVVIDMKWVGAFFAILTEDEHAGQTPELGVLFDEYLLRIGFRRRGTLRHLVGELFAAEDMKVQVLNTLATVFAAVGDDSSLYPRTRGTGVKATESGA